MPWFTPTGQPIPNEDSSASAPPQQDVGGYVGQTMYQEIYDVDNDLSVSDSDRVGGREAYELFDGLRILGKDIDATGLTNDKFLKYDETASKWVLSSAVGTANLADLNDVTDDSPSPSDLLNWGGSEWQLLSKISTTHLATPLGTPLTVGVVDGNGELRIEGGETDTKTLVLGMDVEGTFTPQFSMQVDASGNLIMANDTDETVEFDNTTGTLIASRLGCGTYTGDAPTPFNGGLYYDNDDDHMYMAGDWS